MFVFGSEEDHFQVIRDTVKVSRQLDLDSLQYLILTPLPGTPFYKEMEAQNRIICRDWSQYDGHHAVFQPRQFTPFELQTGDHPGHEEILQLALGGQAPYRPGPVFRQDEGLRPHHPVEVHPEEEPALPAAQGAALLPGPQQLRQWLPGGSALPRVGIPADIWNLCTWEKGPREFLLKFLERLGVEVVQESSADKAEGSPAPCRP